MSFISDFISGFKDYVTQTWKNRPSTETPMSAERLNHIEAGIKSVSDAIKNMASAIMKDMADLTIGASNWDAAEGEPGYVQNRTHWKEYVSKREVILEETSVSFSSNMSSMYGVGTDTVVAGKPYIVHWNGTKYECTAFEANQSVFLGNGALVSAGDDTGEPFCMEMLSATSAFVMKATKDVENIKVKVETPEVVVHHKIEKELLPEDVVYHPIKKEDLPDDIGGGGSSDFMIHVEQKNKVFSSDKTFEEILTAISEGKNCIAVYEDYRYSLSSVSTDKKNIRFARYVADYTNAYPENINFHKLHLNSLGEWNYTVQNLRTVIVDDSFVDNSTHPVQNKVITAKFNEVDANVNAVASSLESFIDSLMGVAAGSVLTVVKDENAPCFPLAEGIALYKCSDTTPTYNDLCNGVTVTFDADGETMPIDFSGESVTEQNGLIAVLYNEIPLLMSVPETIEDEESGMQLEAGFYVLIDVGVAISDGVVVTAVEINGFSFGGDPMVKPERIPDMYYTETGGVILPETKAVGEGDELTITETISGVSIGNTYTVTYNGVPYECVAEEFDFDGLLVASFGDKGAITGEPSGVYPFSMIIMPEEMVSTMGFGAGVMPLDGATSVTISISKTGGEVIHKIPKKYVDVVTKYYFSGGLLYHDEEATQTVSNAELRTAFDSGNVLFVQPNLGYKSKCSYHAIEYRDNADIVESYVILAMYNSASEKVQYVQVYATL